MLGAACEVVIIIIVADLAMEKKIKSSRPAGKPRCLAILNLALATSRKKLQAIIYLKVPIGANLVHLLYLSCYYHLLHTIFFEFNASKKKKKRKKEKKNMRGGVCPQRAPFPRCQAEKTKAP